MKVTAVESGHLGIVSGRRACMIYALSQYFVASTSLSVHQIATFMGLCRLLVEGICSQFSLI